MPLPIIAVVAARLGIRLATYMVGKHLKKGAAKKLRKAITKKRSEIAKKKETSEKGFRGEGSKRKQKTATQRKKPKVDSGLEIKKSTDTLGRKIYRGEERKKHQGYIKDVLQPRRRKAKQEAEAKKVGGIKELRQIRKEAKLRKRKWE